VTGYRADRSLIEMMSVTAEETIGNGEAPALGFGPSGAAVAFVKYLDGTYVAPLTTESPYYSDFSFISSERIDTYHELTLGEVALFWYRDGWSLIGTNREGAKLYQLGDDGTWTSPEPFVEHPPALCARDNSCTTRVFPSLNAHHVHAFVYEDELWFGFEDNSENVEGLPDKRFPYRVVRVLPECEYLSVHAKRLAGIPVETTPVTEQ
jgi:hypothetical protein